jgi:ABC-type polysaccharide/polyol phosphate transport system ATPase subunit
MSTVIKVEDLSKQYRLGLVGTATFKEDTLRWWARMRGKENPFLKLGSENDRTLKDNAKFVWSLSDINFEVQQGDVLGVIGRNGAGKSTLLKILSKVTAPTTGSVKVKGRIASLLEVGTGFHPELTGRENIYLNGAILGMRKHEITRKLDEIIAFAGVEKYIDTPVKRYSSGMYVRLAFAVAAHLENEILIVDEVLSVGDAEFQKKCLNKMDEISSKNGRTIILVSHILPSIKSLCTRSILLENGKLTFDGNVNNTIDKYLNKIKDTLIFNPEHETIVLKTVVIANQNKITKVLDFGDDLIVELYFSSKKTLYKPLFWLNIESKYGPVYGANAVIDGNSPDLINGEFKLKYIFKNIRLLPQEYTIYFGARDNDIHHLLMTSIIIGGFSIVTSLTQLGLGSTSDLFASESAPLLRDYELSINDSLNFSFNTNSINLNNKC